MTLKYLLDTIVISELMRQRPARQVQAFFEGLRLEQLATTDGVLAELRFGTEMVSDEERRRGIVEAIEDRIRPMFHNRILAAGEETWLIWKRLEREGRMRRYTFPQPDLVIAALAIEYGLTVVTRDEEPFRQARVTFINPWG